MDEIKITPREILFSTIIISLMIGLGVWLSNPILENATQNAMKITSSVKVKDAEKFGYIRRTNVGDFIAEGTLIAKDSVSIPDIKGHYLFIKKVKERYTMHTRVYTTSDGKGHVRTHTQIYWSWDVVHTDRYESKFVTFLGQNFVLKSISHNIHDGYKETQKDGFNIRYRYYVIPTKVKGIMLGVCDNKTYSKLEFREKQTIKKIVEDAEDSINNSPTIFWVLWLIFVVFIVAVFYILENNWLED